ncbi:MAG: AAA family ATPase [Candidatus Vogelbacteria bacterium]|nr:AAA family ATPase [Candidatus Vogelbacteria bacterium]
MIYLIGGPPKCGKTTLAKKLATEYQIPWISADTLQNIVWVCTPEEKRPELFPHSFLRRESNDELYSKYSAKQIVENYITQGKTTYDAISMVAETYLTDEDDFIVEGYQITPEVVNRIFEKFGREQVKAVFLVKYDEHKFVQDIHKSTTPNDWVLRKTKEAATFGKIAKMIAEYSRYFEDEAERLGFQVFNMDEDFKEQLSRIEQYLKNES